MLPPLSYCCSDQHLGAAHLSDPAQFVLIRDGLKESSSSLWCSHICAHIIVVEVGRAVNQSGPAQPDREAEKKLLEITHFNADFLILSCKLQSVMYLELESPYSPFNKYTLKSI